MKRIFKYPIQITDRETIEMPGGAKILSAQVQGNTICLWAEVDTEMVPQPRTIAVYGTGNPMPEDPGLFIGTVQTPPFVWHVYETA